MTKIGHAVYDENRKASGGKAGDQTGKEVCVWNWYDKPWTNIFRPNDSKVAEKIASTMEKCCKNDCIGYDQSQRTTLFKQAEKVNFNIDKIKTRCECDCSALVSVCVNASGIKVSKDMYTGNELKLLKNTGEFTVYSDEKVLKNPDFLKRGDILLGIGHTAVVLSVDVDVYKTTSDLNLRTSAGTSNKVLVVMPKGTQVTYANESAMVGSTKWMHVTTTVNGKNYDGWCSSRYLER